MSLWTSPATASPRGAARSDDVRSFLEGFVGRLVSGDARAAAELWDVPALVMGDERVHGAMSNAELARLFSDALLEREFDKGVASARDGLEPMALRADTVDWLSQRVATVSAAWPGRKLGGFLRNVEASTFLVRVDRHQHFKIRALLLRPNRAASRRR
jgi:hypothetical protein